MYFLAQTVNTRGGTGQKSNPLGCYNKSVSSGKLFLVNYAEQMSENILENPYPFKIEFSWTEYCNLLINNLFTCVIIISLIQSSDTFY